MKKVLFISHDASRTGAPMLLLNFLRWFKENADTPFEILLGRGGELEKDFSALAPTSVFYREGEGPEAIRKHNIIRRVTRRLGINNPASRIRRRMAGSNIGLIYSNTSTNGNILQALSFLDCPVISHIHELSYSIDLRSDKFDYVKERTAHFIACSQAVKDNLVNRHNISPDNISVIHEFTPTPDENAISTQHLLCHELKLPEDAFIVGSSGTRHWRKGPDLFIQLASCVLDKLRAFDKMNQRIRSNVIPACFKRESTLLDPRFRGDDNLHFVWIGGGDKEQNDAIGRAVAETGLKEQVHFLEAKQDPLGYFADFDVFALTSREDPFPLVCLEVASLGKPVLCFDKSGGEPEFVEKDCGFVVPNLDVDAMADRVIELYKDREFLRQLGQNAAKKVRNRHTLEANAPKIAAIIEKYLGNK